MPKNITTELSELSAAEFGVLLQEGKIVKLRAGKVTIEHTNTRYGKETVKTYLFNLKPQIVCQEVAQDEMTVSDARNKEVKTPGRKELSVSEDTIGDTTASEEVAVAEDPKPRKRRVKKVKPEPEPEPEVQEKPAVKPGRKKRTKAATPTDTTTDAVMSWSDDDDDYDL